MREENGGMDVRSWVMLGVGLLAGGAIGAAVGMLYAPHKGEVTRGMLMEKAKGMWHKGDNVKEKVESAM